MNDAMPRRRNPIRTPTSNSIQKKPHTERLPSFRRHDGARGED